MTWVLADWIVRALTWVALIGAAVSVRRDLRRVKSIHDTVATRELEIERLLYAAQVANASGDVAIGARIVDDILSKYRPQALGYSLDYPHVRRWMRVANAARTWRRTDIEFPVHHGEPVDMRELGNGTLLRMSDDTFLLQLPVRSEADAQMMTDHYAAVLAHYRQIGSPNDE